MLSKHDIERETLLATIASIERGTSIERRIGDKRYYNVEEFLIVDPMKVKVSDKARFFAEDKFYAFIDDSKWKYEKKKAIEFNKYVHGDDNPFIKFISTFRKIWRSYASR